MNGADFEYSIESSVTAGNCTNPCIDFCLSGDYTMMVCYKICSFNCAAENIPTFDQQNSSFELILIGICTDGCQPDCEISNEFDGCSRNCSSNCASSVVFFLAVINNGDLS